MLRSPSGQPWSVCYSSPPSEPPPGSCLGGWMRRACVLLAAAMAMLAAASTHLRADRAPSPSAPQQVTSPRAVTPPSASSTDGAALVQQYCVTCHNSRTKTGGLVLENLDPSNTSANADLWEKVARKVRGGMMPPQGMPRPDESTLGNFVAHLETSLDAQALRSPNPGHKPLTRLNRTEYGNAIRDLLDLQVDVADLLPPDDESNGFDNIAGVLKVSPSLLEQYLAAARQISGLAVGTDTRLSQWIYH